MISEQTQYVLFKGQTLQEVLIAFSFLKSANKIKWILLKAITVRTKSKPFSRDFQMFNSLDIMRHGISFPEKKNLMPRLPYAINTSVSWISLTLLDGMFAFSVCTLRLQCRKIMLTKNRWLIKLKTPTMLVHHTLIKQACSSESQRRRNSSSSMGKIISLMLIRHGASYVGRTVDARGTRIARVDITNSSGYLRLSNVYVCFVWMLTI